MNTDDMILISVDDHVVEPPDMFENHVPSAYRDRAPRVVRKDDGTDVWVFENTPVPNIALNAVVGRPPEEYGMEPTSFEQIRAGCYDVDARIHDMNANGVLASMCFPSFPSFSGSLFARQPDKKLAKVMLQAYNDWHIDEWCGAYPGRFVPLSLPAIWDPHEMAAEVRRVAAKGCYAVSFTENAEKLGYPSIHSDHWNPVWEACCDEGVVVCVHIGSAGGMVFTSMDSPVDVMITGQPIQILGFASDLLWSPVLRRYPDIRFALSESGIGWIPYFLERADYVYKHHHAWTRQDFGNRLPSEVFREHVLTCFIDDAAGIHSRETIGVDTIAWECDYPHSDSTWPHAPETLARCLEDVSDDEVNKITHENAMRAFRFEAFKHRPREKCTVAALRAESPDVDTSVQSQGGKPPATDTGPVTTADIVNQLAAVFTEVPADVGK